MYNVALKVLNIINNNGYEGYIVGGFVRDNLLGIESNDIDITTNATYSQLKEIFIFDDIDVNFGSFKLNYEGYIFDITTYRKENGSINSRKPKSIEYTSSLYEDLKRRDFTINTICIDKDGKYLDLFNGIIDLNNKLVKSVQDEDVSIKNDSLRILRAIRFATIFNFSIDKNLYNSIIKNKDLLYNLSYDRKKTELDHIFMSQNFDYGVKLITDIKLDKTLEIHGLNDTIKCSSKYGIWAQLEYSNKYNFSKAENKKINQIRAILNNKKIDNRILYNYDLDNIMISGEILNIDKATITDLYKKLNIYKRSDIDISYSDLKKFNYNINKIYIDLENQILYNKLKNKKSDILTYLNLKYEGMCNRE